MSIEQKIRRNAPYARERDLRIIGHHIAQLAICHPINIAPTIREIARLIAIFDHEHALGLY